MNKYMQGKVYIILLIVLVIVGLLGAGGYALVNYSDQIKAMIKYEKEITPVRPSYVKLDKLVISVEGADNLYFMMVEVTLETRDAKSEEKVKYYMPAIRNVFVKGLSQCNYESATYYLKNIDKLQDKLKESLKGTFEKYKIVGIVDHVLITKFVIQ